MEILFEIVGLNLHLRHEMPNSHLLFSFDPRAYHVTSSTFHVYAKASRNDHTEVLLALHLSASSSGFGTLRLTFLDLD